MGLYTLLVLVYITGTALLLFIQNMGKINYNYSLKNIPTSSITSYQLKLIEKVESVIKRMRWKAHFFLNGDNTEEIRKETLGFKSRRHPPQPNELEMFEKDLHIINSIKFRNQKNTFQQKLKAGIDESKNQQTFLYLPIKLTTYTK